jgi:hypothetical protein
MFSRSGIADRPLPSRLADPPQVAPGSGPTARTTVSYGLARARRFRPAASRKKELTLRMTKSSLFALGVASLFGAALSAQNCSDNLWPISLVNAAGAPFARSFDPVIGENAFSAPTEEVFLAFPATLATGTYYVHVTDTPIDGLDEVVSDNDPLDRFVAVTNSAGVITLSLPFSANETPSMFGIGLGGVGQSLRLQFRRSQFSVCRFKAWFGDKWDLSNGPTSPYLLAGGVQPSGACVVRSYESFRIGDGTGSDVTGLVFNDSNRNGLRDSGEAGIAGREVRLVTGSTSVPTTTDSTGAFRFVDVAAGNYTVQMSLPSGQTATSPATQQITVCECGDVQVRAFGSAAAMLCCHGHTIGYWGNCHGLWLVYCFNLLPTLPALQIVNQTGQRVAFGNLIQFRNWLRCANSTNMAYMLSAQLVAMHCNVAVGFVHPQCVITHPGLGSITIAQLMQQSVASLAASPHTPAGHPQRAAQAALKNALDRANNNLNWQ